jgi:hypothetical protein
MLLKTITVITLGLSFHACAWAATQESAIGLDNGTAIHGMLAIPEHAASAPVVLLVAPDAATDAMRPLAQALADKGIASVRYNQQGASVDRQALDAAAWIDLLKRDSRFIKIVVVAHGDGVLPGLLAANRVGANGFVSLAGNVPAPGASSPYDTAAEFGKLKMHARIIQGDADQQAGMDDVRRLQQARPGTPVVIVQGMNHVLTLGGGGAPVAPELVSALAGFINAGPR